MDVEPDFEQRLQPKVPPYPCEHRFLAGEQAIDLLKRVVTEFGLVGIFGADRRLRRAGLAIGIIARQALPQTATEGILFQ